MPAARLLLAPRRANDAGAPALPRTGRARGAGWKTAQSAKRYRIGPHQHPNFPFVLLDRALLQHEAMRYRAHALNATAELHLEALTSPTRELPMATRQRLSKCFTRLRKANGADTTPTRRDLTELIEAMLRERDEQR